MSKRRILLSRSAVLAADALLLLLGLCGALFSFLSCFPLLFDEGELLRTCALTAVLALAVFSIPRPWLRRLLALSWLGWLLFTVWEHSDALLRGVLISAQRVGTVFVQRLNIGLVAPDFTHITGTPSLVVEQILCTQLFTLAASALALWLGWAVVRRKSFWLALLGSAPFLIAPLTITLTPDWVPLTALLLFWMAGLLTRLVGRTDPCGGAKVTFLTLPTAALLLFLLSVLLPTEGYRNAPWIAQARVAAMERLRAAGSQIMASGPFTGLDGVTVDVDLSDAGPLRYLGGTVLRVESDLTGHIYLRGFSAGEYRDGGWHQLGEEAYRRMREGWESPPTPYSSVLGSKPWIAGIGEAQPLNFPAQASAHPQSHRFTLESVGAPGG